MAARLDGLAEEDIISLSFATRLLLSEMERDIMITRALEGLADIGHSQGVGLFLIDDDHLVLKGGMIDDSLNRSELRLNLDDPLVEGLLQDKRARLFPSTRIGEDIPWPMPGSEPGGEVCLVAPMVAANNNIIGLATLEFPADTSLGECLSQPLVLFLTVVAMGLETARLFDLAVQDSLTGLFVRRYFDVRLAEEVARIKRYGGQVALAMFDIDHFKRINDTYGHQVGDEVLKQTAALIKDTVRNQVDVVCRYGGEEFVVIMPSTDLAGAELVGERIRRRRQDYTYPGPQGPIEITLSCGVSYMDQDTVVSANQLLHRADMALYQAKESGRNRLRVWRE